jgi:putative transposase
MHQYLEDQMMDDIRVQVKSYRRLKDIRAGSRNLYHNLNIKEQYCIGTTKFEQLMAAHSLTMRPLRVRIVTTQSSMQSWNYSNLINGLELNSTSQVVVGDLTYVRLGSKVYYLFGLTDLYSARSVGISVSDRMRAEDACEALEEWIDLRKESGLNKCIHHTDGGGQYFSKRYLEKLANYKIAVSVALDCLQNGYAEQRNGLVKHHLMPTKGVSNLSEFKERMQEINYFYNNERKQEGLGWRTPVEYETYINTLPKGSRPTMKLFDFESSEKGFPRHMSTKS